MDVATQQVVARQWPADERVAVGSLAKPFIAYAYSQGRPYPRVNCRRCWKPDGHGEVGIVEAIANSCNTYFDHLRSRLREGELEAAAHRFGLEQMETANPETLLRAYLELLTRREEPGVGEILRGMRESSRTGTARRAGFDTLAKTGTAACVHKPKAPGDGFVIVLYPAEQPRTVLLVRVHGKPGASAAAEIPGLRR